MAACGEVRFRNPSRLFLTASVFHHYAIIFDCISVTVYSFCAPFYGSNLLLLAYILFMSVLNGFINK